MLKRKKTKFKPPIKKLKKHRIVNPDDKHKFKFLEDIVLEQENVK